METASRETRVRAYFERAIASDASARERVLAEARAEHESIATELESLLAYSEATGLLDGGVSGVAGAFAEMDAAVAMPKVIGQYEVIREIGRGGMGVVYEAQQRFPQRRVAIKLVRSDVATPSMMRRFRHEAQALGMLQHAAIAQVLEAGAADVDGRLRSFLAMELAEGMSLHKWVREHKASTRQILELMGKIANGVDHAHKRGVIHRDLKPSNILVNANGEPKILDFGVARLTATDASPGATLATGAGQVIGTLGYMSPEQLSGDQRLVDVRSDVYALGAMLYELLAGRPAIELPTMSLLEAIEAVKNKEAQPLGRVRSELRGDVEAIVGKALEKTVEKRYQSAADLSDDILRYLTGQPVQARPQTAVYQLRKFAARNKVLVLAAGAVVTTLVVSTAAVGWQAVRATRAAERATLQAQRAEETAEVLKRMISAGAPEVALGRELTVREMLDASAGELEKSEDLDPLVRAETHTLLGNTYGAVSQFDKALHHQRIAEREFVKRFGLRSERALRARIELAMSVARTGSQRADEPYARAAYEDAVLALGPDHPVTMRAEIVWAQSMVDSSVLRIKEAIDIAERSWQRHKRVLGEKDPQTLQALQSLVIISARLPSEPRMIEWSKESVRITEEVSGENSVRAIVAKVNLGQALRQRQRNREAFAVYSKIEAECLKIFGPDHSYTAIVSDGVAEGLIQERLYGEAIPRLRRSIEAVRRAYGDHSFEYEIRLNLFANSLMWAGLCDEALAVAEDLRVRAFTSPGRSQHVRDVTMGLIAMTHGFRMEIPEAFDALSCVESASLRDEYVHQLSNLIQGSQVADEEGVPWVLPK